MEYEVVFIISLIILGILCFYNIIYSSNLVLRVLIFYRAKSITDNLTKGDYVHFQGEVKMPIIKSPIFNKACVYWKTFIWASFESKRKKPNKGMQEHSPLLDVKESEIPPLIVSHSSYLMHINFSRLSSVMINLDRSEDREKKPPNETVQKLAKDKYKAYRIHEYRLPNNANVAVWGKIDSIDKNLINIVGSKDIKHPCFLYNGNGSKVYYRLFKRLFFSLSVIVVSCLILIFLDKLIKLGIFGIIGGVIVIGSLQFLAVKKLFKLK